MKKNKISKNWVNKQRKDIYVRQSKVDGYRARSVYKLIEINEKFKIFRNGMLVIDIGAAPGSWSQYTLKDMEQIRNTFQIKGDFNGLNVKKIIKEQLNKKKADVVMSDMAVNTTGIKSLDAVQTGELCKEAMIFSKEVIGNNGSFISKIFMGEIFNEIVALGKKNFQEVKVFKPQSSRKESKENFLICKKLR